MLYRTNRTLSANPTRLNLGTRSLAQVAGANIGNETLRHAHAASPVAVRAGGHAYPGPLSFGIPSIMGPKPAEPAMAKSSGSSPMPSWPAQGRPTWAQVPLVADAFAVVRPVVDSVDSPARRGVAPQVLTPTVARVTRTSLATRRRGMGLAGRSARAAMVSDAAP